MAVALAEGGWAATTVSATMIAAHAAGISTFAAGYFRHGQGMSNRPVFPSAYVPYSFSPALNTGLTVRATGDPARITSAVREQIRLSDPAVPVFQLRTMEDLRQLSFWRYKLFSWMFR